MIKVSIVVPVYNKENSISICLDSLVKQTLSDIEIIVVNDGSTDNSGKVIASYQKKYKNIVFIDSKKNEGIGKTRNKGLLKAKGKYVGFVDGDDYVSPKMYEKYYAFAEKKQLDIVTGDYYKETEDGKKEVFETPYFIASNVHKDPNLLLMDDYGPCNKIFLREILIEHKIVFEEDIKYEDMPFVMKALFHAKKIGHIKEAYYHYMIHAQSETNTMDKKVFDIFKVMDLVNHYYEEEKFQEFLTFLNIHQITRYMLRQKYQQDPIIKKEFITAGYVYLNTHFPGWRKNAEYRKTSLLKRIIKNHKWCVEMYCTLQRT
ncbi:MAG: glycosyltransferase [Bacilli bacterium]|nr:glycosyltransferase [Bacilli bacterium]